MSKSTQELVDILSKLSVLEMADLKKALEDAWGVKAQAAAVMAAPGAVAAAPAEAAEESTEFEVTLTEAPADKKIGVIKVIREITGLGLKEAKDMVEATPKVVKENATKAESEDIKTKLEAAGAKVKLRGL